MPALLCPRIFMMVWVRAFLGQLGAEGVAEPVGVDGGLAVAVEDR